MLKIFTRGIMPDLTEIQSTRKKNLYDSGENIDLDLKFSDYLAMSIAIFRSLFPFVLLIAIVYSAFVYFFLNVWLP